MADGAASSDVRAAHAIAAGRRDGGGRDHGQRHPPTDDWYERTAWPLIVGGKVVGAVHGIRHPDPLAKAVRWSICENEILQSERMPAVERPVDTPTDWFLVGCEIPDELVVDAVEARQAPTPVEEMLAVDDGALLSAPAAARAYPSLWPTVEAAKKALQRDAERREAILRNQLRSAAVQAHPRVFSGPRPTAATPLEAPEGISTGRVRLPDASPCDILRRGPRLRPPSRPPG